MRNFKLTLVSIFFLFAGKETCAQNAMLNILTQNAGIVKKGDKLFIEVSITNTNSKELIGTYKLKAKITVPKQIVSIDSVGHILPTGWKILSNNGSFIEISNGMDIIAATDNRNLLISIVGNEVGGLSTISGQLLFSNGMAPGVEPGSLKNDLPGDNHSTTTCKVIK